MLASGEQARAVGEQRLAIVVLSHDKAHGTVNIRDVNASGGHNNVGRPFDTNVVRTATGVRCVRNDNAGRSEGSAGKGRNVYDVGDEQGNLQPGRVCALCAPAGEHSSHVQSGTAREPVPLYISLTFRGEASLVGMPRAYARTVPTAADRDRCSGSGALSRSKVRIVTDRDNRPNRRRSGSV